MSGIHIGKIDENINFCPHCGVRLKMISLERSTQCHECGKHFLVIGDEYYRTENGDLRHIVPPIG